MRILVINPNTTVEMTKQIESAMNAVKRPDTILEVTNPTTGPAGLASGYDEIVAGYGLVKMVQAAKDKAWWNLAHRPWLSLKYRNLCYFPYVTGGQIK